MASATIRTGTGTITWWKCWSAEMLDAETGMVVDLVALDEVVRKRVVERFDHANLNLDPLFVNRVPTTENLCRAVFGLLRECAAGRKVGVCARGRDGE